MVQRVGYPEESDVSVSTVVYFWFFKLHLLKLISNCKLLDCESKYCCRCDRGRPIKVPPVESYIMVLQPQQPSIEINGTANLARDYQDFRNGVRVFTDLHISVQPAGKLWKHGNCNLWNYFQHIWFICRLLCESNATNTTCWLAGFVTPSQFSPFHL